MGADCQPPAEVDFKAAIDSWLSGDKSWRSHWLGPECTLLAYARQIRCCFEGEAAAKLEKLIDADHRVCAERCLRLTTEGKPSPLIDRAVDLMRSLVESVQAAAKLSRWRSDEAAQPPEDCLQQILDAATALAVAWPLSRTEASVVKAPSLGQGLGKATIALNAMLGRSTEPIAVTAFLALRRLLTYLLGEDDVAASDQGRVVRATMLLCDAERSPPQGRVCDLDVYYTLEGQRGCYVDPVAAGLTVIDRRMQLSIRRAWSICLNSLPDGDISLRIAPDVSEFEQLDGGSAGGLVACAMFAAATGQRLNTAATASVSLFDRSVADGDLSADEETADLQIEDVPVYPVTKKSRKPKLEAAIERRLQRVVLHESQAESANSLTDSHFPRIIPATTLPQVLKALIGDAEMEHVLEDFCNSIVDEWNRHAHASPNDDIDTENPIDMTEHRIDRFVHPTLALMDKNRTPFDFQVEQSMRSSVESGDDPRYPHVCQTDEEGLFAFLAGYRWLCVTEDAGSGKSVFAWRTQMAFSSAAGRGRFFNWRPCLAVRWEGHWPYDGEPENLLPLLPALRSELLARLEGLTPEKALQVAKYALENSLVVLVVDALDQFSPPHLSWFKRRFLEQPDRSRLAKCRVIVTSRYYKAEDEQEFLRKRKWRYGRIAGFTSDEQQDRYFPEDYRSRWRSMIVDRKQVAELLRSPMVLRMLLEILENSDTEVDLPQFRNRGDLYWEVAVRLLRRAVDQENVDAVVAGWTDQTEMLHTMRQALSTIAFCMMSDDDREFVSEDCMFAVPGQKIDPLLRRARAKYLQWAEDFERDEWNRRWQKSVAILKTIELSNRSSLETCNEHSFSFRSLKTMEFYAGFYLTNHASIACRNELAQRSNEERWEWVWRFAIEMPKEARRDDNVLCGSLAKLFEVPPQGRRPTELIYRAWHLFEVDRLVALERYPPKDWYAFNLDQQRDHVEYALSKAAQDILPGADEVLVAFRQDAALYPPQDIPSEGLVDGNFAYCPPDANSSDDAGRGLYRFDQGAADDEVGSSKDERPRHAVDLRPFLLQVTPVTTTQFARFDAASVSQLDDRPMTVVNFFDSFAFCKWLGMQYRLPTEAEWEAACRAGTSTPWVCEVESELKHYAHFGVRFEDGPVAVQQKLPNAWRLRHMHGNVWEWCWDWFGSDEYERRKQWLDEHHAAAVKNPTGPSVGWGRVLRGGAFGNDAGYCRSACRGSFHPGSRDDYGGFRVCREL